MSTPLIARRRVAFIGILAVLFQALLFGWHHHPIPLAGRGSQPIVTAADPAVPRSPVDAEDGCDICMALHHLSASPIEFASLPPPATLGSTIDLPAIVIGARVAEHGFHARAPPGGSDSVV